MAETGEFRHEPVMVAEVLEHLGPREGLFLDGTVGGGGHARAVLEAARGARLLGLDRDPEAVEAARGELAEFGDRVEILRGDFRDAPELLERSEFGTERLVGALLDLGVSAHQIETTARGFSFRPGTPLIMRMGGTTGGRRPAAAFLNEASEEELGRVFREYGEERRWRRLAREVVRRREARPLETSDDLVDALERALGRSPRPRDKARVFQAVRIAVGRELDALEEGLPRIRDLLAQEGRFVVISYHSLEDRIVKHAFGEWSRSCVCPPGLPVCRCRGEPLGRRVVDGPVTPSAGEVRANPRSRSAKLRAWEAS
ncbi:MAG: 16S rRNA (cytosine(1402)-N(4))-methyltransferase RsmH [Gemmatimonadota bacterium]